MLFTVIALSVVSLALSGAGSDAHGGFLKRTMFSKKLKLRSDTLVPAPVADDTPIVPGTTRSDTLKDSTSVDDSSSSRNKPRKKR